MRIVFPVNNFREAKATKLYSFQETYFKFYTVFQQHDIDDTIQKLRKICSFFYSFR